MARELDLLGDSSILTRMAVNLALQLEFDEIRVWGDDLPELNSKVQTAPANQFEHVQSESLFVAYGDGESRLNAAQKYSDQLINLIHPSAVVDPTAKLGRNLFMDALTYIGMYAELGDAIAMSSKATIEHDGKIGGGIMFGASATSCGHVEIGSFSFIGANAVISPRVKIGEKVMVGAGCVVIKDLEGSATYAGNPARQLG